jgi:hypothetical protein
MTCGQDTLHVSCMRACARREAGAAACRPALPPASRALVLIQLIRWLPCLALALEDSVEADRCAGCEHELAAPMDETSGLQLAERVHRVELTSDLGDQLID